MNLKIGDKRFGFICTNIRACAEINGNLVEMVHEETGALLCWADNGENNKLFSVAFKTIPSDDTGVFHILEHSVLCGSKKYPVREPFVELLKSSMNTFLNAMTFPDKTLYPVSSRNRTDYLNLMNVYLDAVFAPMILQNPNIFYQEGHHIERDDKTLNFNGVVFNEMKGAMSGADESIGQELMNMLYPDTCYSCNSGGDPSVIPNLTYEQFIDTYNRFYHPSNARFYLDGAIPLDETLEAIDAAIRGRGKRTDLPEIGMQIPTGGRRTTRFEIGDNESCEDRGRMEIAKVYGTWKNGTDIMAINVLADVLAGSNESVLTHAVLQAGLAQDVDMDIEGGIAQPYTVLSFKNIPDGKTDELYTLVRETFEQLVRDGIDHKALHASLNCYEFRMREPKEPAALLRCLNAFNTWLYGGDPIDGVSYEKRFVELREMVENGAFERLLQDLFLNPAGLCTLISTPAYHISDEKNAEERKRLDEIARSWTQADFDANDAILEQLRAWQTTPDSNEAIATLPALTLSEVDPAPDHIPTEISVSDGVKVLYHAIPGNGIVNLSVYFKLTDFAYEDLPKLSMLENLLGSLGTENLSALELEERVKNDLGRMNFHLKVSACNSDPEHCVPMLAVRCSVLEDNLDKAYELLTEILLRTDFSDEDRIREILLQLNDYNREVGPTAGHTIARACTMAHYGADLACVEAISGYTASRWLRDSVADIENSVSEISRYLIALRERVFTAARMTISVTYDRPIDLMPLIRSFPMGEAAPEKVAYKTRLPERLGIRIPAQIGFSAQSVYTPDYCGQLRVAANILSLDYLWNVVRVRGGAYGTGMAAGRSGVVSSYSYRDPSPMNALEANKQAADYLRAFCDRGESIDKYIISSIASTEPLLSPAKRGMAADDDYLDGYDYEHRCRIRREMLSTDHAALRKCADTIESFASNGGICIVAGEAILNDCEGLRVADW